jgi:chemosensory pili system protein ChpA (sensor histidine kinase/response regulator)
MLPIVATSEFSRIFSSELSSLLDRARKAIETLCERPADEAAQTEILAAYHSMGSMGGMARATAIEKMGRLFERLVDVASTFGLSDPERALSIYFFCQAHLTGVREIVGVTLAGREDDAEVQAEQMRKAVHRIWGDYYYEQPRIEATPESRASGLQPTSVRAAPPPEETPEEKAARIGTISGGEPAESAKPDEDDVLDFLAEMGIAAEAKNAPPPPPPTVEFPPPGAMPRELRSVVEPLDIKPPLPAALPRAEIPSRSTDGSLTFVSASRPPISANSPSPVEREVKVDMEMLQFFIPETEEYCDTMDRAIETWETRPFDSIPQQTLLRLYHTIKGAANSIGLSHLGRLAHGMEDLFTAIDEERLRLGHDQKISLAAKSVQVLRQCLHRATSTPPVFTVPATLEELLKRLERITGTAGATDFDEAETAAGTESARPVDESAAAFSQVVVEKVPSTPLTAAEELEERADRIIKEAAGEPSAVTADAHTDAEKSVEPAHADFAPEADRIDEPAVATTIDAAAEDDSSETFLESQTAARIEPKRLDLLMNLVGELIVGRNQLLTRLQTFNQLQRELEAAKNRLLDVVNDFQEKYEYSPVDGGVIPPRAGAPVPPGLGMRRTRTATAGSDPGGEAAAPVGFSDLEFDRYDDLNILCRALVEIGADANEIITQSGRFIASFNDETDRFSKTASRLQETITAVRMSPLDALFRRLGRVAQEVADKEGKTIAWETEGGATKLDRVVIDQIFQPLLHLVRNAVSHGIESAELRNSREKSANGRLTLRATQRSGQVLIELEDDGGGLDLEAIRLQAVERGLLAPDAHLDEARLINLIFQPGFSTAKSVTDISGRGIGMDVVRREITRLNGSIEIKTRAARGMTIGLRLPLTLTINQAAFVDVGGETYALPANFLDRVVAIQPDDVLRRADGQEMISLGDKIAPLVRLDALFEVPASADVERPTEQQAVVVQLADEPLALAVDRNLGRQDIVVKTLGPVLLSHPFFSGGTVGADGRVILVLDLPGIAQQVFESSGLVALVRAQSLAAPSAPAAPEAPAEGDRRSLPPVLIVDDSLSVRKVAEKYVGELGFRTETAADGVAALEKIKRNPYLLVMTDLEMPRMHGFDLLAAIRKHEPTRELPVIVVTSRNADKHRWQARELGANDYITKPFSKEQLLEKFSRHLKISPIQS